MTLVAEGLTVRRGGRALIESISLTLAPGTLTAVVGPNGAGKSTLLRTLAGEILPDAGTIRLGGRALASIPTRELATLRAVVSQHVHVAFPWKIRDLVALGRMPHGDGEARAATFADAALAEVDMSAFAERMSHQLSGGELQRVHLARALVQLESNADTQRAVLLLDEPTASLDPIHQHEILRLARARAQRGWAVLCILHDLPLATRYADRAVVLAGGRLVRQGLVRETLEPELLAEVFKIRAIRQTVDGGEALFVVGPLDPQDRKPQENATRTLEPQEKEPSP